MSEKRDLAREAIKRRSGGGKSRNIIESTLI